MHIGGDSSAPCGKMELWPKRHIYSYVWLHPRGSAPSVTGLAFGGTCAKRGRPIGRFFALVT